MTALRCRVVAALELAVIGSAWWGRRGLDRQQAAPFRVSVASACHIEGCSPEVLGGVMLDYVLAPASAHEVAVVPELRDGHDDRVVRGDKGYLSAPRAHALHQEHAVDLLTPPRRNALIRQLPGRVSRWNGLRHTAQRVPVETVNAQLTEQFEIGRHGAHAWDRVELADGQGGVAPDQTPRLSHLAHDPRRLFV